MMALNKELHTIPFTLRIVFFTDWAHPSRCNITLSTVVTTDGGKNKAVFQYIIHPHIFENQIWTKKMHHTIIPNNIIQTILCQKVYLFFFLLLLCFSLFLLWFLLILPFILFGKREYKLNLSLIFFLQFFNHSLRIHLPNHSQLVIVNYHI